MLPDVSSQKLKAMPDNGVEISGDFMIDVNNSLGRFAIHIPAIMSRSARHDFFNMIADIEDQYPISHVAGKIFTPIGNMVGDFHFSMPYYATSEQRVQFFIAMAKFEKAGGMRCYDEIQ